MAGQASLYCGVQARGLGIPMLAAASQIHVGLHVASAARQSQRSPQRLLQSGHFILAEPG
jgi:hypothetical protein